MAKRRDYHAEYVRRTRGRGIPRQVARGHGVIPADVAIRLERGDLTASEQREYAQEIERYTRLYGKPGTGHAGRRRTLGRRFDTEDDARDYLKNQGYPDQDDYVEITETAKGWRVVLLR